MPRLIPMVGEKFGRLSVVRRSTEKGVKHLKYVCVCECGVGTEVAGVHLRSGHTRSCGCLQRELMREKQTVHGKYFDSEFSAWQDMKYRCDPSTALGQRVYRWYKNVKVCEQWLASYDAFLSDVGPRPSPLHTLDRQNNSGHYEPGNVRWVLRTVQSRNTKNHCTNTTGVRGVSWSKSKQKWRAAIYVNNVQHHVGYFANIQDAATARRAAEDKLWGDER